MSQFPGSSPGSVNNAGMYNDPYGQEFAEPRKTSGLATAAIICSAVFCCPLTTIAGIILGIAAFVSIGSNPMRSGKGLAITAVILGIIFSIGQGIGGVYLYKFGAGFAQFVMRGPDEVMKKGFAGDIAGFQSAFHGVGSALPPEDAQKFLNELQTRYGTFVSAAFQDQGGPPPQGQPGNPAVPFPYTLTFTNKTVDAEAQLIFADQTTGAMFKKFGYIYVIDPDLGDISYPPNATRQPVPTRGGRTRQPTTGTSTSPAETQPADADGG